MLLKFVDSIEDLITGKVPAGTKRSPEWQAFRKTFILDKKYCECCGSQERLQAHHIIPFHIQPELELEPTNLIVLCERAGSGCHFVFGHLKNFRSFNPDVVADVALWKHKITNRPKEEVNG